MFSKNLTISIALFLNLTSFESSFAEISQDLVAEEIEEIKLSEGESEGFFEKIVNIFSKEDPKGNIVIYKYEQEATYPIKTKTAVATIINLPENEKINFLSSGNNNLFKITNNKEIPNLISIQTLVDNAESNLIIKTDLDSIYNFHLSSRLENEQKPNFTIFIVKDKEQEEFAREKLLLRDLQANNDHIKKVKSLDKLNTSYRIKGSKDITPLFVYDDGKWTYFDFGKNFVSDRLPNVYRVVDQFDSVINSRVEGNLLIAQSLGVEGWTLKNGEKFVCIRPKKSLYEVYNDERFK